MKEFEKRIFKCINGHEYESKECLSNGNGLPCGVQDAVYLLGFIPISPPRIIFNDKANNRCKKCGAIIISETDYFEGKPVAGCVLAPEFYPKVLNSMSKGQNKLKQGGKINGNKTKRR